jgi:hypothetical protein
MKHTSIFLFAPLLAVALLGCKPTAASGDKVFASASADAKGLWISATAAMKTNGYAVALLTLRELGAKPGLTEAQQKVVASYSTSINDQMYAAADKGDAAAKKALEELRSVMGR